MDTTMNDMRAWLITGVAGFIGSNLLEALLKCDQRVVGLDNYSTGQEENLRQVEQSVHAEQWKRFSMIRGDICDLEMCQLATRGVDYVLHQAALGSVPRSIEAPLNSHASRLRRKLTPSGRRWIVNVWGVGYRLTDQIE